MRQSGFIALISILIISALMLLVGVGMVLRAVGETRISIVSEHAARARAAVTSCAEYALMQLKNSSSYAGNQTLNIGGDPCTILPIGGSGGANRTVQTTSTVNGATRNVFIRVQVIDPTMTVTWQNVPTF